MFVHEASHSCCVLYWTKSSQNMLSMLGACLLDQDPQGLILWFWYVLEGMYPNMYHSFTPPPTHQPRNMVTSLGGHFQQPSSSSQRPRCWKQSQGYRCKRFMPYTPTGSPSLLHLTTIPKVSQEQALVHTINMSNPLSKSVWKVILNGYLGTPSPLRPTKA